MGASELIKNVVSTTVGHWIEGKAVTQGSRSQDVFNPATGEVARQVLLGGTDEVAAAVAAARRAAPAWANLPPIRRARVLNKFLEGMAGAVLAKIMVLVFIVIFIQRKPSGLFAMKGRSAEA